MTGGRWGDGTIEIEQRSSEQSPNKKHTYAKIIFTTDQESVSSRCRKTPLITENRVTTSSKQPRNLLPSRAHATDLSLGEGFRGFFITPMTDQERKERRKAAAAAYRAANSEKRKATKDKWRAANPDKVREQARRYREANREKVREQVRKYREANREKVCEQKQDSLVLIP